MTGDSNRPVLVEARGLTRHYRRITALLGVDFTLGVGDAE